MSRLAQVPSHTPLLVDMFLDMISHNTQGHRIPPGLHFKDKSGHFLFHDQVAPYLQGFTTRVCANVLTPHGGGAGSNNATESQNKIAHKQMPVRKAPVAHVVDLLAHMHTVSIADTAFDDGMRRDIWHQTKCDLAHLQRHLMRSSSPPETPGGGGRLECNWTLIKVF